MKKTKFPKRRYTPAKQLPKTMYWWLDKYAGMEPKRERQLRVLEQAMNNEHGITLQCPGGRAFSKELRELVDLGLLKLKRVDRGGRTLSWDKNGNRELGYPIRITKLFITDKGLTALKRGQIKP